MFLQCMSLFLALNVIHGAAKVWSLSDQQRTNCAVGLDQFRSVVTQLYGPAVCCKSDVSDGGDWSCASVSGP
jgi:hypothetical protein